MTDRSPGPPDRAARALLDPEDAFPARLADDRRELARLTEGLWPLPARERRVRLTAIATLAHRLGGAAGTFGYGDVSDAALALEDLILAGQAGGGDGRQALDDALTGLRRALDQALRRARGP